MVYASNLNDQKNITWLTDEDKFWFGKTCGIIFPKQFSTLWKNFQSISRYQCFSNFKEIYLVVYIHNKENGFQLFVSSYPHTLEHGVTVTWKPSFTVWPCSWQCQLDILVLQPISMCWESLAGFIIQTNGTLDFEEDWKREPVWDWKLPWEGSHYTWGQCRFLL